MKPAPDAILDTERAVLGAMLRDNDTIADLLPIVRAEDFATDAHQTIFRTLVALWDAGKPADAVTAGETVLREGHWQNVGGAVYLAKLLDASPAAANGPYYARIVRDRGTLRRLAAVGHTIARSAEAAEQDAEHILEEAERSVFAVGEIGAEGQTHSLGESIFEVFKQSDAAASRGGGVTGVPTGFMDLDELTSGLHPRELVILAARPSVGKTAMCLAFIRNALVRGIPVFFASLEQSRVELAMRLLCSESGVNSHRLRSGRLTAEDTHLLADSSEKLHSLPLHIDDAPNQSLIRIAANARRLKRRHGIGLVVVDYLQLIEPENRKDPRHEQVGQCSRRLKGLARELDVPLLALAQLNRAVEDRAGQRPRLSDLRESGSIEADADTVMLLHKDAPEARDKFNDTIRLVDEIEVIVAKQRNGPTGDVTLAYRKDCMRFEDFAGTPFDRGIA